jgi:RNA polymerase sigma factor (sigma-70 family)
MGSLNEHFDNKGTGNEEDKALLSSFLRGDNDAFVSIYNKYVDELFAYGIGLGFERETLKDAIQDTFVKFYVNKKQLKDIVHLRYYLFRMLKNRLLDIYKSTSKERIFEIIELPFLIEASVLDELVAREDRIALETEIGNLLKILTDRQREAVYLRFIQEMEYEEVASLLDMTPQAVRKLVARAIKRMREENL